MTADAGLGKLIETKRALADKYERLAKIAKGKPKQKRLMFHAERYRRQVQDLSHRQ